MTGDKRYELSDHLGNVLLVINDKKIPEFEKPDMPETGLVAFNADVLSYSDYYPFGMLQEARHGSKANYRYGFQGQEMDNEIKGEGNSLNYTFRMHDPRVGRFFAVDPLFKEYPHYTPYSFSGNKVTNHIEREGLEEEAVAVFAGPPGWVYIGAKWITIGAIAYLTVKTADDIVDNYRNAPDLDSRPVTSLPKVETAPKPKNTIAPKKEPTPESNARPNPKPTAPIVAPKGKDKDDDTVTLYRGVPSTIPTSHIDAPNPAYIPATVGTAVPRGGTDDPFLANLGYPSNYTFWTKDKEMATEFATNGDETHGILLMKKFPKSVLQNNQSPDKFNEGEVQIPGVVKGATPIPVGHSTNKK